jgi:hypothetical protein
VFKTDIIGSFKRRTVFMEKSDNKEVIDKERILKLLEYSKEAIIYWYDMVECSDQTRKENDHFIEECNYFMNKLSK